MQTKISYVLVVALAVLMVVSTVGVPTHAEDDHGESDVDVEALYDEPEIINTELYGDATDEGEDSEVDPEGEMTARAEIETENTQIIVEEVWIDVISTMDHTGDSTVEVEDIVLDMEEGEEEEDVTAWYSASFSAPEHMWRYGDWEGNFYVLCEEGMDDGDEYTDHAEDETFVQSFVSINTEDADAVAEGYPGETLTPEDFGQVEPGGEDRPVVTVESNANWILADSLAAQEGGFDDDYILAHEDDDTITIEGDNTEGSYAQNDGYPTQEVEIEIEFEVEIPTGIPHGQYSTVYGENVDHYLINEDAG